MRTEDELVTLAAQLEGAGWLGKEVEEMTQTEHAEYERILARFRTRRQHHGDDESHRLLMTHLECLIERPLPEGGLTLIEPGDISEFE